MVCEDRGVTDSDDSSPLPVPGANGPSRMQVFLSGLRSTSIVGLQFILVVGALWVVMWVVGEVWVILLPVLLAIIACTLLWPPVRWLRGHGVPPAGASLLMMLVAVGLLGGVIGLIVPSIVDQSPELADRTVSGVHKLLSLIHI